MDIYNRFLLSTTIVVAAHVVCGADVHELLCVVLLHVLVVLVELEGDVEP